MSKVMKIAEPCKLFVELFLFAIFACPVGVIASGPSPSREIFTDSWSEESMSIQTSEYKFSLSKSDGDYMVSGSGSGGSSIEHQLNYADFQTSERLSALGSYACDSSTVDLVIQLGPTISGEGVVRRYYRIVFSLDLGSVITEFYDPSISASNAVLPLQTVEGLVDEETGEKIVCDGSIPTVVGPTDKN